MLRTNSAGNKLLVGKLMTCGKKGIMSYKKNRTPHGQRGYMVVRNIQDFLYSYLDQGTENGEGDLPVM